MSRTAAIITLSFSFHFFYVSLLQLPSQSRAKVSSLGFRLLWLPPVEVGFTHTHRQRHMVRVRGVGCRRLSSCLSEWLRAEDVSAFLWTWGRRVGWRLFFLFLFYFIFLGRGGAGWGGGLEVTDMSKLPHWADPNRKIKVKRFTEHGNCWFLCLFVCTDTHIRNTLQLERGTEAHKKAPFHLALELFYKWAVLKWIPKFELVIYSPVLLIVSPCMSENVSQFLF